MAQTVTELKPSAPDLSGDRYKAIIFNNDYNSIDEVVFALIVATGCDEEEAAIEAWEADHYGQAPVHFASQEECQRVCGSLGTIGLKTEVCKEWDD